MSPLLALLAIPILLGKSNGAAGSAAALPSFDPKNPNAQIDAQYGPPPDSDAPSIPATPPSFQNLTPDPGLDFDPQSLASTLDLTPAQAPTLTPLIDSQQPLAPPLGVVGNLQNDVIMRHAGDAPVKSLPPVTVANPGDMPDIFDSIESFGGTPVVTSPPPALAPQAGGIAGQVPPVAVPENNRVIVAPPAPAPAPTPAAQINDPPPLELPKANPTAISDPQGAADQAAQPAPFVTQPGYLDESNFQLY